MTAEQATALRDKAAEVGFRLDEPGTQRIATFLAILNTWNRRMRLTGERDARTLAEKHVVDSLAVAPLLPTSGTIVDVGTGAGFPGVVLSCVRPDLETVLVDSRRRPVSFLREVIRRVPLPRTQALERRGQELATDEALRESAALVVGRALRLDVLLLLASPLVGRDGIVVAMQTPGMAAEEAARQGSAHGLSLMRLHDYRLPGGENRRLLLFARTC
jgi:16S rRNA (guanine527-N7)-methyltransferase